MLYVISAKSDNPLAEIKVLGRPNWIVYDESSMEEKFHAAEVLVPSRFFYDRSSDESRRFVTYYKSLFDRTPAKSFPMQSPH